MQHRNRVGTAKIQVSVDRNTDKVLEAMIPVGLHGKNKSEVASWIIREWIWHNQEALGKVGVHIAQDRQSGSNP